MLLLQRKAGVEKNPDQRRKDAPGPRLSRSDHDAPEDVRGFRTLTSERELVHKTFLVLTLGTSKGEAGIEKDRGNSSDWRSTWRGCVSTFFIFRRSM